MIPFILLLFLTVAQPPGIARFEQLNEHLYRGGQPGEAGFQTLAKIGVRTVIDLRYKGAQSHWEKHVVESLGMRFIGVPMDMHAPSDGEMDHVLRLLNTSEAWPIFVHCEGGKDRTGTVIACYRITHDGWSNEKAYREARQHGLSTMEVGLRRYILNYRKAVQVPSPVK
ncbi:MAG TPA: tyrosine-protein phosphatase [Bryobacteraceae bacterium]|nr:tyrosine-protein phosphatase [Bryobacteraceae bacterium]